MHAEQNLERTLRILVVFRTGQAYNRFWDGSTLTHQMRGDWFDAASSIISFTRTSKADSTKLWEFRQIVVRLFSALAPDFHLWPILNWSISLAATLSKFSMEVPHLDSDLLRPTQFTEWRKEPCGPHGFLGLIPRYVACFELGRT